MSSANVVTMGYGAFGDVPHVVLLGYEASGELPPAPPVVEEARRFGGGPFWKRYGYGKDYDDIREQEEEQSEEAAVIAEIAPEAEDAVQRAVDAIGGSVDPMPAVLEAEALYARVVARLNREIAEELDIDRLERARVKRIWEAEVRRRVQESEDEEIMTLALSID